MFCFYIVMSLGVIIMLMFIYMMVSNKEELDKESESPYECGFEVMTSNRIQFSHRFFLISVLFLIFDVEIVLLLPIPYLVMSVAGVNEFFVLVFVLVLGLLYEYYYGSLDWL